MMYGLVWWMTRVIRFMKGQESSKFSLARQIFFFCHWYAESEQAIIDKLSSLGADDFCITMATKTNKPVVDQKELENMLLKVD